MKGHLVWLFFFFALLISTLSSITSCKIHAFCCLLFFIPSTSLAVLLKVVFILSQVLPMSRLVSWSSSRDLIFLPIMSWYLLDIVPSFSFDTHLFTEFIFSLVLKRILKLQITIWWSEATSALGKLLACRRLISICCLPCWSKFCFYSSHQETPTVHSGPLLLKIMFASVEFFAMQKFKSFSPLLFISPHPKCPMTFFNVFQSLPTFAFRSPCIITKSWFGVSSTVCWSWS